MLTGAAAKKVAREARRWGYHDSGRSVYVYCPLCRSRVEDDSGRWGGTVNQRLDRAMVVHLADCQEFQGA